MPNHYIDLIKSGNTWYNHNNINEVLKKKLALGKHNGFFATMGLAPSMGGVEQALVIKDETLDAFAITYPDDFLTIRNALLDKEKENIVKTHTTEKNTPDSIASIVNREVNNLLLEVIQENVPEFVEEIASSVEETYANTIEETARQIFIENIKAYHAQIENKTYPLHIPFIYNVHGAHWIAVRVTFTDANTITVASVDPMSLEQKNEQILQNITEAFPECNVDYAPPRTHMLKQADGESCGPISIENLMHMLNDTTPSKEDMVKYDLTPEKRGDITVYTFPPKALALRHEHMDLINDVQDIDLKLHLNAQNPSEFDAFVNILDAFVKNLSNVKGQENTYIIDEMKKDIEAIRKNILANKKKISTFLQQHPSFLDVVQEILFSIMDSLIHTQFSQKSAQNVEDVFKNFHDNYNTFKQIKSQLRDILPPLALAKPTIPRDGNSNTARSRG